MGNNKKVDKTILSTRGTQQDFMEHPSGWHGHDIGHKRGFQVYNLTDIVNISGRSKDGQLLTWGAQQPFFYLSIRQRNEIFRLSTPIFGVVSSRMKKMAGLDFDIVPVRDKEDEIVDFLNIAKSLFDDFTGQTDLKYITIRENALQRIQKWLPDVLPDLSNYKEALLRFRKRNQAVKKTQGQEIKDWLMEPNQGVTWDQYVQKVVFNLMIHGSEATYKQAGTDGKLENFDSLLGGTTFRLTEKYFSGMEGYVQVVQGYEPQIFFSNEVSFLEYLPTSTQHFSFIPLEALINKIVESMLFDAKMASEADGTRPPEKLIIVTDNQGLGAGFDKDEIPLDKNEQSRIEQKVNEPKKNAIVTFSGNAVEVVDLSTNKTMDMQSKRTTEDISKAVALVYNMSNMEINLTGSGDTSGRNTSEAQGDIEEGKGVSPLKKQIAQSISKNIIPFRFGYGWMMEYETGKNEMDDLQMDLLKQQTGDETMNEMRERKRKSAFKGEEFDKPQGIGEQAPGLTPDGSPQKPFNMTGM